MIETMQAATSSELTTCENINHDNLPLYTGTASASEPSAPSMKLVLARQEEGDRHGSGRAECRAVHGAGPYRVLVRGGCGLGAAWLREVMGPD